jgi:hypothetical protein
MAQNSDARNATKDIFNVLKSIFKQYSRTARKKSWDNVTSKSGESIIKKIINDPSIPTPGLNRLAFKEWLEYNSK